MQREFLKKWLSYYRPQSHFFDSVINEQLEVVWVKGKKILNTKGTNYSYGGLQEVLNYGLDAIPISSIKSILVLGMGGGCVVDSLRNKYNYQKEIIGVEIDPVVVKIAKNEFHLLEDKKVQLIEADAETYIAKNKQQYDLIIVDLFIDIEVPQQFYGQEFWKNIANSVEKNGFVLFNAGIDLTEEKIEDFLTHVPDSFVSQITLEVLVSNTVIIFNKVYAYIILFYTLNREG